MQKMLCAIDEAIEEKYKEIKGRGKVLAEIEELNKQIRYERPELAAYIKKQMLDRAKREGDLPL